MAGIDWKSALTTTRMPSFRVIARSGRSARNVRIAWMREKARGKGEHRQTETEL